MSLKAKRWNCIYLSFKKAQERHRPNAITAFAFALYRHHCHYSSYSSPSVIIIPTAMANITLFSPYSLQFVTEVGSKKLYSWWRYIDKGQWRLMPPLPSCNPSIPPKWPKWQCLAYNAKSLNRNMQLTRLLLVSSVSWISWVSWLRHSCNLYRIARLEHTIETWLLDLD